MKKIGLIKLVAFIALITVLCAAAVSCSEWKIDIPEDSLMFIKRNTAEFKIIYTSEPGSKTAAEKLVSELEGVGVRVNSPISDEDTEAVSNLEIIFGASPKNRDGFSLNTRDYGKDGYIIKMLSAAPKQNTEDTEQNPEGSTDGSGTEDGAEAVAAGAENTDENTDENTESKVDESQLVYKLLIGAGNAELMAEATDALLKDVLELVDTTDPVPDGFLFLPNTLEKVKKTRYPVSNIHVSGIDLSSFAIATNNNSLSSAIKAFTTVISANTGVELHRLEAGESAEYKILFRINTGSKFTIAYQKSSKTLAISCPNVARFPNAIGAFEQEVLKSSLSGTVDLANKYEWSIAYRYSEFGAAGDGVTDDFGAMLNTHEAANRDGIPVMADKGAKYYIGESSWGKTISVKTSVDFQDAEIIIDDRRLLSTDSYMQNGVQIYYRDHDIFSVDPSDKCRDAKWVSDLDFQSLGLVDSGLSDDSGSNLTIWKKSDDSVIFPKGGIDTGLGDILRSFGIHSKVMIHVQNNADRVYIRYGMNENQGSHMQDLLICNADGTLDKSTPFMFDYYTISSIKIIPVDEDDITIQGGKITNRANQPDRNVGNVYSYYSRGIRICRSDTTLKDMTHKVTDEQSSGGFPYNGFLYVTECNNILIENVAFSGHKVYIEDRDSNNNGKIEFGEGGGSSMGSYDIGARNCNNVRWVGCTQLNSIYDSSLWGIMGANFIKNVVYERCNLSRFDAHQGVYNATIKDSHIGLAINIIGSGRLEITGTTRYVGSSFVSTRQDYGCTWEGDVIIRDCHLEGYIATGTSVVNARQPHVEVIGMSLQSWNFGYKCYLPTNIVVDNFTTYNALDAYLFYNNASGSNHLTMPGAFADTINPYVAPRYIEVKNQTKELKLCNDVGAFTDFINSTDSNKKLTIVDTDNMLIVN